MITETHTAGRGITIVTTDDMMLHPWITETEDLASEDAFKLHNTDNICTFCESPLKSLSNHKRTYLIYGAFNWLNAGKCPTFFAAKKCPSAAWDSFRRIPFLNAPYLRKVLS